MPRDGRRIVGGEILQYVAVGSPALGESFSMFYKTAKMTADGWQQGGADEGARFVPNLASVTISIRDTGVTSERHAAKAP